jgi:nicotinate-nucleotide pyrophosphorylase (carboxylating)
MNRKKILEKAFQRGHLLSLKNNLYKSWIEKFIVDETKGDIGKIGDITSNAVISDGERLKAIVKTREAGIVAGLEETIFLYNKNNIQVKQYKKDGDRIKKGDKLLELTGNEKDLLKIERSSLDLMQRMSGIATLTCNILKSINNKVGLAPTRKTQWRYLDKKAVFIGKGLTHRLALWESILIKDNHLKALKKEGIKNPIPTSLERAWKQKNKANFIEIEVINTLQAIAAAKKFKELQKNSAIPCLIMLDNMSPRKIKDTIAKMKKLNLHNHVLIEASGGINPKNIKNYCDTGIDVISMGYLTHSSHALDIKQYIL